MNDTDMTAIVNQFAAMISAWDWLLIFLVWLGLHTFEKRFSEWFVKPRFGWRLMPFIPVLACTGCCFVPGPWLPAEATWMMRVLFGSLLGVLAYNFGGIANRLGFGKVLDAMGVETIVSKTRKRESQ